jgi:hypothetical protein
LLIGDVGDNVLLLLEPDEDESDKERERESFSTRRISSRLTLLELRVARLWRVSSSSKCSVNFETTILSTEENDDLGDGVMSC